ncbi:MAG: hypothetical protein QW469_01160 [Candidatus Aenigmatarchaeota archaeon]
MKKQIPNNEIIIGNKSIERYVYSCLLALEKNQEIKVYSLEYVLPVANRVVELLASCNIKVKEKSFKDNKFCFVLTKERKL